MAQITIEAYQSQGDEEIIGHILAIQRDEFNIPITREDQPDLAAIQEFYLTGGGNFLLAFCAGRLVGTLGLLNIGGQAGALRKMFVHKDFRGAQHGVAAQLLSETLRWAADRGFSRLYLGTTDRFLAAHRFYEKNGFVRVGAAELPESFPRMKVDNVFYQLDM